MIKGHHFLSSSKVWSRVGGHQARGQRHSVQPAGGSAEGGGCETSRDEFLKHRGRQASSLCPPWRTSCLSSLLCAPSLLPLKREEQQEVLFRIKVFLQSSEVVELFQGSRRKQTCLFTSDWQPELADA